MAHTVDALAERIESIAPTALLFFASGGVPYVLAALDIGLHKYGPAYLSRHPAHLFPGLLWEKSFDGLRPEPFFRRDLHDLLQVQYARLLVIDTVVSGSGLNKILKVLDDEIRVVQATTATTVHVIGIVNQTTKKPDRPNPDRFTLYREGGARLVQRPPLKDWPETAKSREPFALTADSGLKITAEYWLESRLIAEDQYALLAAERTRYAVAAAPASYDSLPLRFRNGFHYEDASLEPLADRLIWLITRPPTHEIWSLYDQLDNEPPEDAAAQSIRADFLRVWQLKSTPANQAMAALENLNRPFMDCELSFLMSQLDKMTHTMRHRLKLAAKKAAEDGDLLVGFLEIFRALEPEHVASEVGGCDREKIDWWLERFVP